MKISFSSQLPLLRNVLRPFTLVIVFPLLTCANISFLFITLPDLLLQTTGGVQTANSL